MRARVLTTAILLIPLYGCKVGPNYKRPVLSTPDQYRGLAPDLGDQSGAPFAEMKWQTVFQDKTLQELINEALTNNYNIRIAATHIVQAEASLGVTRSNQLPALTGTFGVQNEQSIINRGSPTFYTAGLQLNYMVDFWGQYRRATEAARADLLATRYAQHVVETTLISDVANAYYLLRQYDPPL